MKSNLPPELQATIPKTTWGRILSSTPVVMTVVATLLAGLASSEMTHAQYDRSMASQQQSKAGDQWAFFQAKRLRALIQQGTLDALELVSAPHPGAALTTALQSLPRSDGATTAGHPEVDALASGRVPEIAPAKLDPSLQAALSAIAAQHPEAEISPLVSIVSDASLAAGMLEAKAAAMRFDEAIQPVLQGMDRIQATVIGSPSPSAETAPANLAPAANPGSVKQDFVAARLRFTIHRYEAEARLNQTIATLYEVLVRKSNLSADRHYARSQRFFYGMLAAQLSVIMSTFATAVRMRNTLWTLAALAGLFAVALAAYVYLVE